MRQVIKKLIPDAVIHGIRRRKGLGEIKRWASAGKPLPVPHIAKQLAIEEYKNRYGLDVLVETGTFMGDMVEAERRNFKSIHSIELSEEIHGYAAERFRNYEHIHLYQGDSSEKLKTIVGELDEPALFWLDGHYSGFVEGRKPGDPPIETARGKSDCPVPEELRAIFPSDLPHIVLIDDAADFGRDPAYPTVEAIGQLATERAPGYTIEVAENIIRLVPPEK